MVLYRDRGSRAAEVAVVSARAAARGIRPGMPLAEALGLAAPEAKGPRAGGRKAGEGRDMGQAPSAPSGGRGARSLGGRGSCRAGTETPPALGDPPAFAPSIRPANAEGLDVLPHDPAADRAALTVLAEWCGQFSPIVGLEEADEPECLLLDVTGLARLFGGERRLAEHLLRDLVRRGWSARLALADTAAAAWALAKYGRGTEGRGMRDEGRGEEGRGGSALCLVAPGRSLAALARLPIAALRLADDVLALLRELGIERVEQLLPLPRSGLAARFGPDVLRRLDEATGARAEVIAAQRPAAAVEAAWEFETPTERRDALVAALERLLAEVVGLLERRCQGVGEFHCRLTPQSGAGAEFTVGLFRPSGSPRHLMELAQLHLERLTLSEPIAAVRVAVSAALPLEVRQRELGFEKNPGIVEQHADRRAGGVSPPVTRRAACDSPPFHRGGAEGERQLAALLDRLASRLGRGGVLRARLLADAQPEYACRWDSWISRATTTASGPARRKGGNSKRARGVTGAPHPARRELGFARRPLLLARRPAEVAVTSLAPAGKPARFVLRGREHRVCRCWGPERIETGWWRAQPARRDYYRVESDSGGWFWLFRRRRDGRWFWHGAFE